MTKKLRLDSLHWSLIGGLASLIFIALLFMNTGPISLEEVKETGQLASINFEGRLVGKETDGVSYMLSLRQDTTQFRVLLPVSEEMVRMYDYLSLDDYLRKTKYKHYCLVIRGSADRRKFEYPRRNLYFLDDMSKYSR